MRQIIIDRCAWDVLKSLPSVEHVETVNTSDIAFRSAHVVDIDGSRVIAQVIDDKTDFDGQL